MFYTYILKSLSSQRYYIGNCDNIENRLKKHNRGEVKSTKKFIPWVLVYKEIFNTRREAVTRERQMKSWKSRKTLEKLIEKHF